MAMAVETNENLNIVQTYYYKGTKIQISDNYCCNATKVEVNKIIERCNELWRQAVAKEEYNKCKSKEEEKIA